MVVETRPIEEVHLNKHNPRLLKDERFAHLVQSIQEFPEMLQLRPLVVDEQGVVLGGNMRLHALMHLNYTQVPVLVAVGLTEAQKQEFVIKDNASFGEWDWNALANEWSDLPLQEWGLDLPKDWLAVPDELEDDEASGAGHGGSYEEEEAEARPTMTVTFTSPEDLQQAESDVQELLDRKYPTAFFTIQVGLRNG